MNLAVMCYDAAAGEPRALRHTAPVGSKPVGASPYGALDMAGYVREWVNDWWDADYYLASPPSDPPGPPSSPIGFRVLRDGSWADGVGGSFTKSYFRFADLPTDTGFCWIGFRCARDC